MKSNIRVLASKEGQKNPIVHVALWFLEESKWAIARNCSTFGISEQGGQAQTHQSPCCSNAQDMTGIFLGLILGRIWAPFQSKISKNFPKMVYIIPDCLALHFGEDFMKIWKNGKVTEA